MTGQDMLSRWANLSALLKTIIVSLATVGAILASAYAGGLELIGSRYATHEAVAQTVETRVAPVERRVEAIEKQAHTTQREVTRVQIHQSQSEIRQINNSVFELQKATDGNLLALSPVERAHYDYLQDELRKATRERDEAETRFRLLGQ